MGIKVVIQWQGLEQAISTLLRIEEMAPRQIERQVAALAKDTEKYWRQVTPRGKTGRLQGGDVAEPDGLSFTLRNTTRYYPFVDTGHMTARGWRTSRGYRFAKRRSHVQGREMTSKTVRFIVENINNYLSKFLDNV